MKKIWLFLILGTFLISLVGCAQRGVTPPEADASGGKTGEEYEIKVTPEGAKYIVEPGRIVSGGIPKDAIPSIDHPKYVSLEEADQWIQDNELVLAITYKGIRRVYPLQIMVWHEIVNDSIAGEPILITY